MIGPREVSLTASAIASITGDSRISPTAATTRSKVRLIAKSMPSNTGGRSVNSGTVWPGTNSARSIRISIVVGATCTVTPALVADVDELDRALLREVGVGDDHLLDALGVQHLGEPVDLAERAQPVLGARLQREVADEVDAGPRAAGQRVRNRLDVLARADQHGAAPVAGLREDPPGHPQVQRAQRADVDRGEEQRAVEDVVAREVVAAGEREHQRDHRRLEQRGDDPGQPGPACPLGVEVDAGEHQHGDQVGERDRLARVRPGQAARRDRPARSA